jgi:hypothetical protein
LKNQERPKAKPSPAHRATNIEVCRDFIEYYYVAIEDRVLVDGSQSIKYKLLFYH